MEVQPVAVASTWDLTRNEKKEKVGNLVTQIQSNIPKILEHTKVSIRQDNGQHA